ncbi:MAG TPA: glycosyltransferase [Methylomirabilota bacterium]|nr:glycosyltransferase [Methylomirabilota bacterium]
MTTPRRVLLVTYHFPPAAEVGALRGEKFAKYLPEFGWRAHVLTVARGAARGAATTETADVERTAVWPGPRDLYQALRARRARPAGAAAPAMDASDRPFEDKDAAAPGAAAMLKRAALSLLWWPDEVSGWWPPAVLAGRRLLRRHRFDALITTGPPHTAHLVGLALARPGLPWIADLRDPWAGNPGKPRIIRSALSDALDRRGERAVLARASAIVVGTERFRAELARRHPDLAGRLHLIPAGVDAADFDGIPRVPPEKFTVAHIGELYYRRSPEPLFAGLGALVREHAVPREEVEVLLAGMCRDGIDAAALARRHGIDDLLRLRGQVPRRQALELMMSAGALVLLAQAQPLQVPAKAFEYVAAGAPIIAVTGDGATSDLIGETGAGWVVAPDDVRGMRAALLGAYGEWRRRRAGEPAACPETARRFDRRQLTGRLAALLDGGRG